MFDHWHAGGASVKGTSHQRINAPHQDAMDYVVLPNGVLILAIADGAGSARRSEEGAKQAVATAVACLTTACQSTADRDRELWDALMRKSVEQARRSVFQLAESEGTEARDFASTLLCVAATRDVFAVAQIGDSVAIIESANGIFSTSIQPQQGEYASETFFLTMDNALDYVETLVEETTIRSIIGLTDGLLRLATRLPNYEPHEPFFRPLLAFVEDTDDPDVIEEQLTGFLTSDRVSARTDDDKTLFLAVRLIDNGKTLSI